MLLALIGGRNIAVMDHNFRGRYGLKVKKRSAMPPIEGLAMQVHYGFDVENIVMHAVNDSVGKAMEVELAVVSTNFPPACRFGDDATQGPFELIEEVVTQARLPLFIPQCRAFQFLVRFRMADDVH